MNSKKIVLTTITVVLSLSAVMLVLIGLSAAGSAAAYEMARDDSWSRANDQTSQQGPITFPRGEWPWYAQDEISVVPEPPIVHQPTELCAEVINLDADLPHNASLEFRVALFGIGMMFEPVGATGVSVPPGGHAVGCVVWVPPQKEHWGIEVTIHQEEFMPERSQRVVDVDEPLLPNRPHARPFTLRNPFEQTVDIYLALNPYLLDWMPSLSQEFFPEMGPGEEREVVLIVTPTAQLPPIGQPIVDVEAFVDDELIGGFRKIYRPPILLHRFPDPPYAEREITIHPYPPLAGEPTEVCVDLYNPTPLPQTVVLHYSWANFGIGLPFAPINGPQVVHLPPFSMVRECINWIPPVSGHVCLEVVLEMAGYEPQRSQRNIDVYEPLVPGQHHALRFVVGNPLNQGANINLEFIPHLDGWQIELQPRELLDMEPGMVRTVTLTVQPPPGLPLPPNETVVVDVEAFADGQPIGGFRKIHRPPIKLHPYPDPTYAEREITIHPYPPLAGEPTEVCVDLRNPTPFPQDVVVHFSWANFGIGLPFTPINGPREVHLPPFSLVRECIHWVPPVSGHICLEVILEMDGYDPQRSQRNIDVYEPLVPGEPHTLPFPVGNPFQEPFTITMGLIPHIDGWEMELWPEELPNVDARRDAHRIAYRHSAARPAFAPRGDGCGRCGGLCRRTPGWRIPQDPPAADQATPLPRSTLRRAGDHRPSLSTFGRRTDGSVRRSAQSDTLPPGCSRSLLLGQLRHRFTLHPHQRTPGSPLTAL